MADEEVMVEATSPVPSDHHKRKLEDLEPEPHTEVGLALNPETVSDSMQKADGTMEEQVAGVDGSESKRPRLEDKANGLASQNGCEEKVEEESKVDDDNEQPSIHPEVSQEVSQEAPKSREEQPADDNQQTGDVEQSDAKAFLEAEKSTQVKEPSKADIQEPEAEKSTQFDEPSKGDMQEPSAEVLCDIQEEPSAKPPEMEGVQLDQEHPASDDQTIIRKMEVPNNKVGVLIGKSGDTIRYLQYNSGAKIQIMRDADTDPHAASRPVELIGTLENINKAEKLIKDVIAEADAGGSPALVARGFGTVQAVVGEQIEIQVPNEKVGLIIGKGGETIKSLQTRSGARTNSELEMVLKTFESALSQIKWRLKLSSKRRLETDILALCTEIRAVVMVDYGGKMPELQERLCAFLKHCKEDCSIFKPLHVMVIEDMIYLVHARAFSEFVKSSLNLETRLIFVDLEHDPPKIITQVEESSVAAELVLAQKIFSSVFSENGIKIDHLEHQKQEVRANTDSSFYKPTSSLSSEVIDLGECIKDSHVTVPTLNGWLLGYPIVYLFGMAHIENAIYNLSTKSLHLFQVLVCRSARCNRGSQAQKEELMSFSVPYDLSSEGMNEPWVETFLTRIRARQERCNQIWISLQMEVTACYPQAIAL